MVEAARGNLAGEPLRVAHRHYRVEADPGQGHQVESGVNERPGRLHCTVTPGVDHRRNHRPQDAGGGGGVDCERQCRRREQQREQSERQEDAGQQNVEILCHHVDLQGAVVEIGQVDALKGEFGHHEIFTDVTPGPADQHPAEPDVGRGYTGCNHRVALEFDLVTAAQQQTGDGPVLADGGRGAEEILMEPNTIVHLKNGHLHLSDLENQDNYLWTDGIISFSGDDFGQIINKLRKYFGVSIEIQREELPEIKYKRLKVRTSEGVDHILRILQRSSDFTYEYNELDNKIIIR